MDTFETLTEAMQGFGISMIERTRLAFGAPVLKALASLPEHGKVFVACDGGAKLLTLPSKLTGDAAKLIATVDATSTDFAKVRPHVVNFAKGRKVAITVATIRDADDRNIGFTVTRKA